MINFAGYTLLVAASRAGLESRISPEQKVQQRTCDQKKCKSCKFYVKAKTKYAITHCEKGTYLRNPMQVACDRYEKKRK